MAVPTTGVYFSGSFPPAPPGDQVCLPQTDGEVPEQSVTFVPRQATTSLRGTVKPDGTSILIADDGTISAPGLGGGGGGTGGTGGTGSASGGLYVCVSPTPDPTDGTRTQWILPAPQLAGTIGWLVRNGVTAKQNGTRAEFSVQGTQLTLAKPLEDDGLSWIEYYYIQGTPNSQQGGGGSVNPATNPVLRGVNGDSGTSSGTITVVWPAGTQAGDLAVVMVGHDYGLSVPSGWTLQTSNYNAYTWNGFVMSKVLTSGDISTGSVTISASNSQDWLYLVATFIGSLGGVREVVGAGGSSVPTGGDTLTTSGAVAATDTALYFASSRSILITPNRGNLQKQVIGTNCQGVIYGETLNAAGAISTAYAYTGGAASLLATVIVKAF